MKSYHLTGSIKLTDKFIRNCTRSIVLAALYMLAKSRFAGNVLYFPIQAMSLQSTVFTAQFLTLLPHVPTQLEP